MAENVRSSDEKGASAVLAPPLSGDDATELIKQLQELTALLKDQRRAEVPSTWYGKAYSRFKAFANYVGMPGLLIAAIIPVYNLVDALRDYQNKLFVRSEYTQYAYSLLETGDVERANKVMAEIAAADKYDVRSQYANATVLNRLAIRQGKRHQDAIDRTAILLRIQKDRPFYFPRLGSANEVFELELGLVDIDIQLQQFPFALRRIERLMSDPRNMESEATKGALLLRRGTLNVLQFKKEESQKDLVAAERIFASTNRAAELAECHFQLAKLSQLSGNNQATALRLYERARSEFEKLGAKADLVRVLNNIGMIHSDNVNFSMARFSFEEEQRVARESGDEEGLARSLVNLSLVARNEGSLGEAVRLATEALEAFRLEGSKLGMAAAYQNLANTYSRQRQTAKALYNGEQAAAIFQNVRDVRGVASTFGVLAPLSEQLGEAGRAVYYYRGTIALRRYLGAERTAEGEGDIVRATAGLLRLRRQVGEPSFSEQKGESDERLRALLEQLEIRESAEVLRRVLSDV